MQEQNANAAAEPSLSLVVGKQLNGTVKLEPSLTLVRIPRCPACGEANPQALDNCPSCGVTAPNLTDHRTIRPVLTEQCFPWYARLLLWIGAVLARFANWLHRS